MYAFNPLFKFMSKSYIISEYNIKYSSKSRKNDKFCIDNQYSVW